MLDFRDEPKRPRQLCILNGMEVIQGVGIGYNLNRVARSHRTIDFLPDSQSPSVSYHISIISTLGDDVGPDPILSFAGLSVTYNPVVLHAINLPIRRYE